MRKITVITPGQRSFLTWDAHSFLSRLKGFMGKTLYSGDALLLTPCNQIHCCFMKSKIDVLFLSSDSRVLAIEYALKPFSLSKKVKQAHSVLELCAGDAEYLNITVGMPLILAK